MTAPVEKRKRDWFRILRALSAAGVSMAQVARECGRSHSTVKEWQDGCEPKESDGRIVLALLAKHAPSAYMEQERVFGIRVKVSLADAPRPDGQAAEAQGVR